MVFAIAVRYRRATAYSVGLLAAVSYSLLLWQGPQMRTQFNLPHILIEPFLLFISGVLTSDILLAQRRRSIMAEQEHARTDEILQETIRKFQTALTINTELERQIAGQTASVATISDKIVQLWKLHDNERYTAIVDTVMHAVEAQSCALYVQHNQKMYLSACRPAGVHKHAATLHLEDPLISRVLRYRQVSTIRDVLAQEQAVSQKVAVMAGPLINQNEQVVGIVVVDNMPMLKFTPSAVHLFSSILHMASIALQTASPMGETAQNRYSPWVDLYPTAHTISAGPHTPLPGLELDQHTYRSWVALYPTEHTIPAVKLRGM